MEKKITFKLLKSECQNVLILKTVKKMVWEGGDTFKAHHFKDANTL